MNTSSTKLNRAYSTPNIEKTKNEVQTKRVVKCMPRTLVQKTNKEFDKCAELLRNILSVQELRRSSKSNNVDSKVRQRKKVNQKSTPSNVLQKSPNKSTTSEERRSPYSYTTSTREYNSVKTEDLKIRSPGKSRRTVVNNAPNTLDGVHDSVHRTSGVNMATVASSGYEINQANTTRRNLLSSLTSSLVNEKNNRRTSPINQRLYQTRENILYRSSSCGDIPRQDHQQTAHSSLSLSLKSKYMSNMSVYRTKLLVHEIIAHLINVKQISKELKLRVGGEKQDKDMLRLWEQLEQSLAFALTYTDDQGIDIDLQMALQPLRNEIVDLRRQLRTANASIREHEVNQRNTGESEQLAKAQCHHLQKKLELSQTQLTNLLFSNQEIKSKCETLQEKLSILEKENMQLIERWTQLDLRSSRNSRTSLTKINSDTHFLLREHLITLKNKVYHLYEDLGYAHKRNNTIEISNIEKSKEIQQYRQYINDLKQTSQQLMRELENITVHSRLVFSIDLLQKLTKLLMSIQQFNIHGSISSVNSGNVHANFYLETAIVPVLETPQRLLNTQHDQNTKLRLKQPLFVSPSMTTTHTTILNDFNSYQHYPNRTSTYAEMKRKLVPSQTQPTYLNNIITTRDSSPSSSSRATIYDADSTLSSSGGCITAVIKQVQKYSSNPTVGGFIYQTDKKSTTLYNSLPTLINEEAATNNTGESHPSQSPVIIIPFSNHCYNNNHHAIDLNDSDGDFDQISDLTSKIFSNNDEDENENDIESSSLSTVPSEI
ncbi:unnamed protein product [Didymodactylos carnosus]|uniref:Uncharacterized protein n=1 Tax=Didymodactylos carnosus TaxID=1234261 RepID=A0A814G815_9BILA|nr:unnamed protein product [Didymodactylos carnosus]CAF0992981.1 unnamed protein product [Didymodactylos carnosus]CAF3640605.1 unnamed protein product [Didymodactylos carnosus]CAF3764832.1 unnamed protein product [Didymodactylos carnosus]